MQHPDAQKGRARPRGVDLALSAAALLLALGIAEALVRLFAVDQRLIAPVLFLQGADVPNHRVSTDSVLHYELAPNTAYENQIGERRYRVTIDEHGARYPTHTAAKPAGVFRILGFGASTVYGSAVEDHQTIPAALERRLNVSTADGPRYEVWNFGTCGYTFSQVAHLARVRFGSLDPDLLLVQVARSGRRAFLMPASGNARDYPWSEVLSDPHLFEEQFDYLPWLPPSLHLPLLRTSALTRAFTAALPGFGPSTACSLCESMDRVEAQDLSREAEGHGIPVVYYVIPAFGGRPKPDNVFPGLRPDRFIDLYEPGREPDFYEVHPPPPTLDEFARLLAEKLRERGLLEIDSR